MNRKGITPVIAIVILLMITVAGAGAAYVWIHKIILRNQKIVEINMERKLEILQTECEAGTPNLNLIIINSGIRTVDMIPFTILVYDSAGKMTSITKTGMNESSLSDSAAWKLAQKPSGYSGEVTVTLNDNFVSGEYYSNIVIRFLHEDYEISTSCQAQ